jgi:type III secretion protein U
MPPARREQRVAGKNDSGDKTEKPTPKKLADARKKGDVAKSKDVTATATLFVWFIVFAFGAGYAGTRVVALFDHGFALLVQPNDFALAAKSLGLEALWALIAISAVAMIPAAITGVLTEFLQAGGVFTTDKLKPSLDKLNPIEGLKKMFSMDNVIELLKTLAKSILIVMILWLVLRGSLAEIIDRTGPLLQPAAATDGRAAAASVLGYTGSLVRQALLWTFAVFVLVAVLDLGWQKHSFMKKMRMSLRDIRQEFKENEGDPLLKGNRRQLHEEWASQNAVGAARGANVLVVNPTHIAIAIDYDAERSPVPVVAAKGEGPLAQAMREAAEEAGVPIVRHVTVARKLYEDASVEELIPRDMFEAIAQIILWAKKVRSGDAPQHHDLEQAQQQQRQQEDAH